VVPASEYRALQHQVHELQRLLGKKTLENGLLRDALELAQPKNGCCGRPWPHGTIPREGDIPSSEWRAPILPRRRQHSGPVSVADGVRSPMPSWSPGLRH
jgi:hypothetical protein